MVSLNRSFLYGIGITSLTWIICLYLYSQLNQLAQSEKLEKHYTHLPRINKEIVNNNVIDIDDKSKSKESNNYKNEWYKKYKNSEQNIKKLQPVFKTNSKLSKDEKDLTELGLVANLQEKEIKDEGYKIHAYNVLVSNRLSLHRKIPDTRNKLCGSVEYPLKLPNASIIICFYNEHFNTLLRSIHSIIDRTPSELLHDIILIDDYSDIKGLHLEIKNYIDKNFVDGKVKLFKTEKREGLIRARVFGAKKAQGETLIFLDSHIEVNKDWIQPLLGRIKENRTNVVVPVIDVINPDTFAYTSSPLVRGGFNWGLHFKWENLPKGTLSKGEDFVKPIKSPTMAGGLFAINRQYFIYLGEYDSGMNIWGGENLEISFRIWMCGGNLEMLPCSRVGHVFRQRRPYGSPDGQDTMLHNSLRVAHVWMDEYKEYFLSQRKEVEKVKYGDISSRLQLRKELGCKSFDWYIKNVYPEIVLPSDDDNRLKNKWAALEQDDYQPWHTRKRNYVNQYQIKLTNSSLCLTSEKDYKAKGGLLTLKPCMRYKSQMWYETDRNELVLSQLLCLQSRHPKPFLYKCHEMGGDQEWKHKGESGSPIYNMAAGTCLGVEEVKVAAEVVMTLCADPTYNKWDLVET